MKLSIRDRIVALLIIAISLTASAAQGARVSGLRAFYREGQTFLTWREDDGGTAQWYKVYVYDQPITNENLDRATFIAQIPRAHGVIVSSKMLARN